MHNVRISCHALFFKANLDSSPRVAILSVAFFPETQDFFFKNDHSETLFKFYISGSTRTFLYTRGLKYLLLSLQDDASQFFVSDKEQLFARIRCDLSGNTFFDIVVFPRFGPSPETYIVVRGGSNNVSSFRQMRTQCPLVSLLFVPVEGKNRRSKQKKASKRPMFLPFVYIEASNYWPAAEYGGKDAFTSVVSKVGLAFI